MKKIYSLLLISFLAVGISHAQEANEVTLGLGLGLEYGGVGGQVAYQVDNQIGVFVGLGTAFVSPGYNLGMTYLLPGKSKERFFLEAMYGYNAVIFVDRPNGGKIRNIYYGPSIGGGVNLDNKGGDSFWHLAILIPVRNSAYRNEWNAIKNDPEITTFSLPFSFTVGINFRL